MRTAMRIAAVVLCASACQDEGPAPTPAYQVAATPQITFTPASVTVPLGSTVTWTFGAVPHNVTFSAVAGRPTDIPGQNTNVAVGRTFTQPGTFGYACTLHPGMAGSVTVSPNSVPPGYVVSP